MDEEPNMNPSEILVDEEIGTIFYPLKMTTLTPMMIQKAQDELGETEEKVQQGLKVLRNFIDDEKLPLPKDDSFLLLFLRGKKFRLQESQNMLRYYMAMQLRAFNYHAAGDFSRTRRILESNVCGLLPFRDEHGRIILFVRTSAWNPSICSSEDFVLCMQIISYFAYQYPPSTICGLRAIVDASVKSKDDVMFHVNNLKFLLSALKGFPMRFQQIDIINENVLTRIFVNTFGRIFPKIIGRIRTHGADMQSLVQNFHPSVLPEEFGGTLGPLSPESYVEDLKKCVEEFKTITTELYKDNH